MNKVYVVHSPKPVPEIKETLTSLGGFVYAGIIYRTVSRRGAKNDKEETMKTIVICKDEVIKKLEDMPEYKGKVTDYDWETFPTPCEDKEETWDLHVSGIPFDFTVKEAKEFVHSSLNKLLKEDEYTLNFAPRFRETGEIFGYGQVMFNESVPHETRKLCKLMLHNTAVMSKSGKDKRIVTCIWYKLASKEMKNKKIAHIDVSGIMKLEKKPLTQ